MLFTSSRPHSVPLAHFAPVVVVISPTPFATVANHSGDFFPLAPPGLSDEEWVARGPFAECAGGCGANFHSCDLPVPLPFEAYTLFCSPPCQAPVSFYLDYHGQTVSVCGAAPDVPLSVFREAVGKLFDLDPATLVLDLDDEDTLGLLSKQATPRICNRQVALTRVPCALSEAEWALYRSLGALATPGFNRKDCTVPLDDRTHFIHHDLNRHNAHKFIAATEALLRLYYAHPVTIESPVPAGLVFSEDAVTLLPNIGRFSTGGEKRVFAAWLVRLLSDKVGDKQSLAHASWGPLYGAASIARQTGDDAQLRTLLCPSTHNSQLTPSLPDSLPSSLPAEDVDNIFKRVKCH